MNNPTPNQVPLLSVNNLIREFNSTEGREPLRVLRGLSLEVARGESIAIVGSSGCGKTTLLNLIGTLDQPTSGTLTFDGRDLSQLDAEELALLRNCEMGFIFQSHHLLPQCSVIENVLVPTIAHRSTSTSDEERGRRLLDPICAMLRMPCAMLRMATFTAETCRVLN